MSGHRVEVAFHWSCNKEAEQELNQSHLGMNLEYQLLVQEILNLECFLPLEVRTVHLLLKTFKPFSSFLKNLIFLLRCNRHISFRCTT